jgi:hypothetical protein
MSTVEMSTDEMSTDEMSITTYRGRNVDYYVQESKCRLIEMSIGTKCRLLRTEVEMSIVQKCTQNSNQSSNERVRRHLRKKN